MVTPYLVYFLGPFALAFVVRRQLALRSFTPFVVGAMGFLSAWVCGVVCTVLAGLEEGSFYFTLLASSAAGVFEELSRFAAFSLIPASRGGPRPADSALLYAAGHSGMESMIVGGTLLLTVAVVQNAPELLEPAVLESARSSVEVSLPAQIYAAFERLFVGMLVHASFCLVVLLAVLRRNVGYLLLAILWHFAHDMVGMNLWRLSSHVVVERLWVLLVCIVDLWALVQLRVAVGRSSPVS